MTDTIRLHRDQAADSIAIVRLLRSGQTELATFVLGSYGSDCDALQGLVGSMAALAASFLAELPDADYVLARASAAVATFDPSDQADGC